MAQIQRVVVHILGCHVEAKRANGFDWERINWAKGTREGRIPHGLHVALESGAAHLSFGTGASERAGHKEAVVMAWHARENVNDLLGLIPDELQRVLYLLEFARLDTQTQNTTEEMCSVFDWVQATWPEEDVHVVFVTSAFHAARATNEAAKVAHKLFMDSSVKNVPTYAVSPAYDSPGETFVFEESHRGDMPMIDWSPLKKLFGLFKKPKVLQELINHMGTQAERIKEGPND
ncbi:MAG: ElyC/SanA/YdcF family protein [Patescibacteria group bacterium UBA2103]